MKPSTLTIVCQRTLLTLAAFLMEAASAGAEPEVLAHETEAEGAARTLRRS